jgi:hypothetical protein
MFFSAKLTCGVEILINAANVASVTFNEDGVKVDFPNGRVIHFPNTEKEKIHKALKTLEGGAPCPDISS